MKLYEFVVEIHDGAQEYNLSRYVAADSPNSAAQFARRTALEFYPDARYDPYTEWYQATDGYPIWRVTSVNEVSEIVAPAANGSSKVKFAVRPVFQDEEAMPRLRSANPSNAPN